MMTGEVSAVLTVDQQRDNSYVDQPQVNSVNIVDTILCKFFFMKSCLNHIVSFTNFNFYVSFAILFNIKI